MLLRAVHLLPILSIHRNHSALSRVCIVELNKKRAAGAEKTIP